MDSEHNVQVTAVFACDDVRLEVTGKQIFIGVYGPDIGVETFPTQISISFVMLTNVKKAKQVLIKTRILGPSGAPLVSAEISFESLADQLSAILPATRLVTVFSSSGTLCFQVDDGNEDWRTVGEWRV